MRQGILTRLNPLTLFDRKRIPVVLVAMGVVIMSGILARRASPMMLVGLVGLLGLLILARWPAAAPPAIALAALVLPLQIGTGTEVKLSAVTLVVPLALVVWLIAFARHRVTRPSLSGATSALAFFVGSSLLSLLVGTATWDPAVPKSDNLILVQLAQCAIFALSAGAWFLSSELVRTERLLRALTLGFLALSTLLGASQLLVAANAVSVSVGTRAIILPPFWMLVTALAAGQIFYNHSLSGLQRIWLVAIVLMALGYTLVLTRDNISGWIGVCVVLAVLLWLRFPRLRWPLLAFVVILAITGILFPSIYDFAGGEEEWTGSGGSRLVLIQRVIEVTMRNPITGLGPAAYRHYAMMKPLPYLRAYWLQPQVNSHNNYVDLFAHGGLLSLALFGWFAVACARTGLRLRRRYTEGFAAGYLNAMLAAGAGSLVIMAFADWILPHVYNIGFPGFQASVLVWLFMGGIVAVENFSGQGPGVRDQESGGKPVKL